MAYTTAVLLIVLVFVGLPLQLASHDQSVVSVVGTTHGILYVIYLVVAFRLTLALRVPKWQMALVLLAGTIPFAAFVAERKMSRRFAEAAGDPLPVPGRRALACRQRWFSRRSLLLHLAVLVVAPACGLAGWWQATRALAGNSLSWVYSIEWPIFGLIAVGCWWQLVHEDPATYRARRERARAERADALARHRQIAAEGGAAPPNPVVARMSTAILAFTTAEFFIGVGTLVTVPFSRPSGWLPGRSGPIYLVHAVIGALLVMAAAVLVLRARDSERRSRLVAWIGFVSLLVTGMAGLVTVQAGAVRLVGATVMFIGSGFAACVYLIPGLARSASRPRPTPSSEDALPAA